MRGATEVFRDERGFTSVGMAVALLVSLTLIFSSVQVYRVNTLAAEVQEVADAAVLAAENQVGEFMIAVRVADATILSLTLVGVAAHGLGIIGLCVPPAAEIGAKLITTGEKVLKARDQFSDRAASALNELQKALPLLAAAAGASVAAANSEASDADYHVLALLLPAEGQVISTKSTDAESEMVDAVEEGKDDLAQAAEAAEEAVRRATEAKQRAFQRDCGDAPDFCMYERASNLATLNAVDNPLYQSVDAWSFAVSLRRARSYYSARLLQESYEGPSIEEKVRSVMRKRFYAYASQQLSRGYVVETNESFSAYFPHLPRNVEQMKRTVLYTEPRYPITVENGTSIMHAWDGCPEVGQVDRYGSVKTMVNEHFPKCAVCQFSVESLGKVASASTSIDNGFEYHYEAVAQAAEEYEKALSEARPSADEAKSEAEGLLEKVLEALHVSGSFRIDAHPPGTKGCIAFAVATGGPSGGMFETRFVARSASLGPRVACSAATLVPDETEDASVVGDILSKAAQKSLFASAGNLILNCWAALLNGYEGGVETLIGAIESALNSLPLVSASGLGTWAADKFREGLVKVGLQPADTNPLRAVLANSAEVARKDGGAYAQRFLAVRERARALPGDSPDALTAIVEMVSNEAASYLSHMKIEIAIIEIPGTDITFPLTVTLPPQIAQAAAYLVQEAYRRLSSVVGMPSPVKQWR